MAKLTLSERMAKYFRKRALMAEKESQYKAETKYMTASEVYNYGMSDVKIDENNLTSKRARVGMALSKYLASKQTVQPVSIQRPTFPQGSTLVDKTGKVHNYATGTTYRMPGTYRERYQAVNPVNVNQQNVQSVRDMRIDYEAWVRRSYKEGLPAFSNMTQANGFAKAITDNAQKRLGLTDEQRIHLDPIEADMMDHAIKYMDDYRRNPQLANKNQYDRIQADRNRRTQEAYEQARRERESYQRDSSIDYKGWVDSAYKSGLPQFMNPRQAVLFSQALTASGLVDTSANNNVDVRASRIQEHCTSFVNDWNYRGQGYALQRQFNRTLDDKNMREQEAANYERQMWSSVMKEHPDVAHKVIEDYNNDKRVRLDMYEAAQNVLQSKQTPQHSLSEGMPVNYTHNTEKLASDGMPSTNIGFNAYGQNAMPSMMPTVASAKYKQQASVTENMPVTSYDRTYEDRLAKANRIAPENTGADQNGMSFGPY